LEQKATVTQDTASIEETSCEETKLSTNYIKRKIINGFNITKRFIETFYFNNILHKTPAA
jgi:hypothetical protein